MEWVRGEVIGHGNFGTVNLAIPRSQNPQIPPLMAVKSCSVSNSASLVNEKSVLDALNGCSEIVGCFGDGLSFENGEKLYNVFLEYASGGALADLIKNSGNIPLPEKDARSYTRSILRGIHHVHKSGYVHCDIKLQNILLFSSEVGCDDPVKIADFGLAKKSGEKQSSSGCELRGTPLYMAPETVTGGEQEPPSDIWALGCVLAEMVTGSPAWRCREKSDVAGLLMRIGVGEELPEIPGKLSAEGKDFLGKCFVKDPRKRWTAEMLLNHPFVANSDDDREAVSSKDAQEILWTSPRCPFDFPGWVSPVQSPATSLFSSSPSSLSDPWSDSFSWSPSNSPAEKLRQLTTELKPDWSFSESWITVR